MATKPVLKVDAAGTLTFTAPEYGSTGASATVKVYDENGTITSINGSTATVVTAGTSTTGAVLSIVVSAAIVDAIAPNYRAEWSYTIGTTNYVTNQIFDVVKAIVRPTLNTNVLYRRFPELSGRVFLSTAQTHAQAISDAWGDLHDALRAKSYDPNRIIDALPFEHAHAAWTAGLIARSYQPTASDSGWIAWSNARDEEARRAFDAALSDPWWYDRSQDLLPGGNEESPKLDQVLITR